MKTHSEEASYECLRAWALQPSSVRPSGVAQLLQGGLITWLQTTQVQTPTPSCKVSVSPTKENGRAPLSALMAAMIAEVLL